MDSSLSNNAVRVVLPFKALKGLVVFNKQFRESQTLLLTW